jgi:hypothetical protein
MAMSLPPAIEDQMKYEELRKVDVSKYVEKKNGLTYLSWAWSLDQLLLLDPTATWEYTEPRMFGSTMMVFCTVNAFGVSRTAQLPVMNHRNQAVENPDSFQVNTAMQRCLAKAIALHGLGLYIYNGEDLPPSEEGDATLTDEDIGKIAELAEKVGSDVAKIAAFYKVESLNQIPRTQYGKIIATLNKKRLTNAGVQDNG